MFTSIGQFGLNWGKPRIIQLFRTRIPSSRLYLRKLQTLPPSLSIPSTLVCVEKKTVLEISFVLLSTVVLIVPVTAGL